MQAQAQETFTLMPEQESKLQLVVDNAPSILHRFEEHDGTYKFIKLGDKIIVKCLDEETATYIRSALQFYEDYKLKSFY